MYGPMPFAINALFNVASCQLILVSKIMCPATPISKVVIIRRRAPPKCSDRRFKNAPIEITGIFFDSHILLGSHNVYYVKFSVTNANYFMCPSYSYSSLSFFYQFLYPGFTKCFPLLIQSKTNWLRYVKSEHLAVGLPARFRQLKPV